MQVILFPSGDRIGFDNVHSYKVNGQSIDFTMDNGQVRSIFTSSVASAIAFIGQIDGLPPTTTGTQVTLTLVEPYIITSIEAPFTLQQQLITIHGSGFLPTNIGVLWIEDVSGGMDYNGIECQCYYIDANTMRANWTTFGDNALTALVPCGVLMQYADTVLRYSNIVTGYSSNDGLTIQNP